MPSASIAGRVAAVAYVCWSIAVLAQAGTVFKLATELPEPMGIVIGRVAQLAWILGGAALLVAWAALSRLRLGTPDGFWICLVTSALIEVGQATLIALPGYERGPAIYAEFGVWLVAIGSSARSLRISA